jgi:uncharacterized protein CbrC (UPF0167 family)
MVGDDPIVMCYECLRNGEGALTKDSPLGMISWDQAFEGVTHGVPGLRVSEFELVRRMDSEWVGARVPSEFLFELLRTPTYVTIQGDQWQFCCRQPMTYIGTWSQAEFNAAAPGGKGRLLFDEIVQNTVDGLWEDRLHDITGIYVFRCRSCGRRTAHWDIA